MNIIQKSEAIMAGLRKSFQDSSSKIAHRKCYGYEVSPDGELAVNLGEAQVLCWIFVRYLSGKSLVKIAACLEARGSLSPTSRSKWNWEAIGKLLPNEKYTGRGLLQKTISADVTQIENDGLMERYLYAGSHEAIISDETFLAVQREKQQRSKTPEQSFTVNFGP